MSTSGGVRGRGSRDPLLLDFMFLIAPGADAADTAGRKASRQRESLWQPADDRLVPKIVEKGALPSTPPPIPDRLHPP